MSTAMTSHRLTRTATERLMNTVRYAAFVAAYSMIVAVIVFARPQHGRSVAALADAPSAVAAHE